jgi:hypothetical protein
MTRVEPVRQGQRAAPTLEWQSSSCRMRVMAAELCRCGGRAFPRGRVLSQRGRLGVILRSGLQLVRGDDQASPDMARLVVVAASNASCRSIFAAG